jgi:multiple sugar transport system substrate-binding protein
MSEDTQGKISRRRFLEAAGAGIGTLAFPTILLSCGGGSGGSSGGSGGGGSSGGNAAGPGNLSVLVGKDTAHPTQQAQLLAQIKKQFEDTHHGSTVTFDTYATAGEETTKLETAVASHEGPDVFEFGSTLIPTAWASKSFEVLTDAEWNQLGGKQTFFPAQLTMAGPSPNQLIGVPVSANPFAMVYNKRLFDAAGIKKAPATWNDFIGAAKELTKPDQNQWGSVIDVADGFDPWHLVWLFTTQLGGNLISTDGKKAQLDSAEAVEGTGFWLDWVGKHKIASRQGATYKAPDEIKAFAAGQVGMMVMQGPGGIPTYQTSPVAHDMVWAPDPTVPYGHSSMPHGAKPAQGFVSGQYWSIFKYGKNKALALELAKLMVSPEIQYQTWKLRGQTPVVQQTFTKYPDTNQPPWDAFNTAEQKSYPIPFSGAWGQLEELVGQAITKLAAGIATTGSYQQSDLKAALSQVNQQLQSVLQGQG